MSCTPEIERAVDALLSIAAATEEGRLAALSEEQRSLLKQTAGAVLETLNVALVFLAGFDDANDGGPVSGKLPETTRAWVHRVERRRSGALIGGVVASSICGLLEGYIVAMTPRRVTPTHIAKLRAAGIATKDDAKVLKDLTRRVKPTTNQEPADWIRALREAFDVTLEPVEEQVLVDLIMHRNLYSHDPAQAVARNIAPVDIKCWTLAALHLCHRIGAPADLAPTT
jgi:hypothetical protein